jgi:hypothetical protein
MNYKEFTELLEPFNHLYNIVMKDGRAGLRGCDKNSVEYFIKLVGKDAVKIFIY